MKLEFYYWSYQCPLNNNMIELLREYEEKLDIQYHDISKDFLLSQKMNMFFPTLIVVNNKHRYFSPLNRTFLNTLVKGDLPIEKPYRPKLGMIEKSIIIKPIKDSYMIAGECTGQKCFENCYKKILFYQGQNISSYGYINVDNNNRLLGGAEYMPSMLVPYKIPKDDKTAFLTCVYISDSDFDYKSGPLKKLENHLVKLNYTKLLVITDEIGIFPNGDIKFFIRNGYEDIGIISKEDDYCTLHLMCKYI